MSLLPAFLLFRLPIFGLSALGLAAGFSDPDSFRLVASSRTGEPFGSLHPVKPFGSLRPVKPFGSFDLV